MRSVRAFAGATMLAGLVLPGPVGAQDDPAPPLVTGRAAMGDWHDDVPGRRRRITVDDLPAPYATRSASNGPGIAARPPGALPRVPAGFTAELFASGLDGPRLLRIAPNGDLFVVESLAGQVRVFSTDGRGERAGGVFVTGLDQPFGLAFYPPGSDPQWLYVANTNSVVRFPYRAGDRKVRGPAETIVARLTKAGGGHWTRDIAFSPDGRRMFVSIGSQSNVAQGMARRDSNQAAQDAVLGAAWGDEEGRASVVAFTPDGRGRKVLATGIRNCVGLAIAPATGDLWCSTNERDGLGDDLVPDYVTRVREGGFYGWPWYYLGPHEDPRHRAERPDLKERVSLPDILIQSHSAPLQMAFDDGETLPPSVRGSAWAALHGSWNRARRTGYKVVRILLKDGVPTGEYEDFVTGFVADERGAWARPVGLAFGQDGSLFLSEDGNGTLWRILPGPSASSR